MIELNPLKKNDVESLKRFFLKCYAAAYALQKLYQLTCYTYVIVLLRKIREAGNNMDRERTELFSEK
jgi:hypothetical protein